MKKITISVIALGLFVIPTISSAAIRVAHTPAIQKPTIAELLERIAFLEQTIAELQNKTPRKMKIITTPKPVVR